MGWANGAVTYPALTGDYSALFRKYKSAEGHFPDISDGDLKTIHQPLDGYGLNIYSGNYIRTADNEDGFEELELPEGYPRLDMPWLNIVPEAIIGAPVSSKPKPISRARSLFRKMAVRLKIQSMQMAK